ncbi:MAG: hypothetical protein AAF581_10300 [Planctomycetota bacterium]
MGTGDNALRDRIKEAVGNALQPLSHVLAGWESGSVAFDLEDEYSDIDLNFLLDDASPVDPFYTAVESALETVSPIVASHSEPPGRYFKLTDGGDFLLVDVCTFQTANFAERLDSERHGRIRPLFDKGEWLRSDPSVAVSHVARRARRLEEHRVWFSISQSFVRKAILRGQHMEALAAFWGYTLKPLVELLRMRYCPPRWDFGMRYLDRDLPGPVYEELRQIMFVGETDDLPDHLSKATEWAERLIEQLEAESSPRGG